MDIAFVNVNTVDLLHNVLDSWSSDHKLSKTSLYGSCQRDRILVNFAALITSISGQSMVNEHVPTIHECKWDDMPKRLFFDITAVYYVSCLLLPFICSWYDLDPGFYVTLKDCLKALRTRPTSDLLSRILWSISDVTQYCLHTNHGRCCS